jgi:hypothetical protein
MATKPTRLQQQACDHFAEALVLITEGARLDGKGILGLGGLTEIARRIAQASSAFDLDTVIARALERRVRALALRSGTAELLTLLDTEIKPLEMLLLSDEEFKELIGKMEADLGEI